MRTFMLAASLALTIPLHAAAAQSASPQAVNAAGMSLTPFPGGCFADPAQYGDLSYQGLSLVAGDCPAGGGYYIGPFASTSLSGHLSAGPAVEREYRNLGGGGGAPLSAQSVFQSNMGLPRPSHTLFDQVGGRMVRVVLVTGGAGSAGPAELASAAQAWMNGLKQANGY